MSQQSPSAQSPLHLLPQEEGEEGGRGRREEEDSQQHSGSGPGQEGEGRKYLCSHLNVNQVWLEQGSRDRGGRSKREPNRREEVEMGVVRGRGRGSRERARARQCWGHWEQGWGQPEASHPKQSKETGQRLEV